MIIPTTNGSLLLALQSQSPARREAAWAVFEPLYRPVILAWCGRQNLAGESCDDLAQAVLLKLSVKFPQRCFDPDRGRFHGWLKAFTRNVLADCARALRRQVGGRPVGGTDHLGLLAGLETPELADQLSDVLASQPVTQEALALARVRDTVNETHWRTYCLYHADNRPAREIAAELGLSLANVHKILKRVEKRLAEEVGHG